MSKDKTEATEQATPKDAEKTQAKKQATPKDEAPKKAAMKKLIIHNQEGAEGKQAVFVSVNGKAYNIPRNTAVEVPIEVIDVLKNSNMSLYDDKGNETTAKRFVYEVSDIDEE